MSLPRFSSNVLALDVGSSNTVVASHRRDVICRVPTLVALSFRKPSRAGAPAPPAAGGQPVAVGAESRTVTRSRRETVRVYAPVVRGRMAEPDALEHLLRALFRRERLGGVVTRLLGGTLVLVLPGDMDEAEQARFRERVSDLGYPRVRVVDARAAAAAGCRLDVAEPRGQMVIDLGGGKVSAATFALGGVATSSRTPMGGADLDQAIAYYVHDRYRINLSAAVAERIKLAIGSVYPKARPESLDITGRDLNSGIEKRVSLDDNEIRDVLIDACEPLLMAIQQGFEDVPPELAGDVARDGVHLVGGGALLAGLPEFLAERTGLTFRAAPDPINAVIRGALRLAAGAR